MVRPIIIPTKVILLQCKPQKDKVVSCSLMKASIIFYNVTLMELT